MSEDLLFKHAFLTSSDVAQLFGVDIRTVRRWAGIGKLPHIRTPGGQYRYRSALIASILSHRTERNNHDDPVGQSPAS